MILCRHVRDRNKDRVPISMHSTVPGPCQSDLVTHILGCIFTESNWCEKSGYGKKQRHRHLARLPGRPPHARKAPTASPRQVRCTSARIHAASLSPRNLCTTSYHSPREIHPSWFLSYAVKSRFILSSSSSVIGVAGF